MNHNNFNRANMYKVTAGFKDEDGFFVRLESKRLYSKDALLYTVKLINKYGRSAVIVEGPEYEELWSYIHRTGEYGELFNGNLTGRDIKLALLYICNVNEGIPYDIKKAAECFFGEIIKRNLLYNSGSYNLKISETGFIRYDNTMYTNYDGKFLDGILHTL